MGFEHALFFKFIFVDAFFFFFFQRLGEILFQLYPPLATNIKWVASYVTFVRSLGWVESSIVVKPLKAPLTDCSRKDYMYFILALVCDWCESDCPIYH